MTFEEHWNIGVAANPLLANHEVLRAIAECAWNAGAKAEREACAKICDRLATMMEQGAGELEPSGRLRQAARTMRSNVELTGSGQVHRSESE